MFINAGVLPKYQKNIDNILLEIQFLYHIYYSHTHTHLSDSIENIQSEEIQPIQEALPVPQLLRHSRRTLKIPKQPNELLETDF